MTVNCPYCGKEARITRGAAILPNRKDLRRARFFICDPCEAWVRCKPGTDEPMGRLANKVLRDLKHEFNRALERKVREMQAVSGMSHVDTMVAALTWLAKRLRIPITDCAPHLFDEFRCREAIDIVVQATIMRKRP